MTEYSDVVSYLNALGMDNDLSSFVGRKRIQKAIYILKRFDDTIKLPYTWYLHGSCSPTLHRCCLIISRMPRKGRKFDQLLDEPDARRWHENLRRGSEVTADVYLRRLGGYCLILGTTPKELVSKTDKELDDDARGSLIRDDDWYIQSG